MSLSRRSIVSSLFASVPAIAVAAAAAPTLALPAAASSDPVIALAEEAIRLHLAFVAACEAYNPFDNEMIAWRKKNPPPMEDTAGLAKWKRRRRDAERRTGYRAAESAMHRASGESNAAIEELIAARPRTLAGLAAKAKGVRITDPDDVYDWELADNIEALVSEA